MIKLLFEKDKKPSHGLLMLEWVMVGYIILTTALMLLWHDRIHDLAPMVRLRLQAMLIVLALWGVYWLRPCRLTILLRVLAQVVLLGEWYPETFEFNRLLPNLDHVFATWEQQLFGYQPALLFSQKFPSPWVSELLTLGYVSYFPLMVIVPVFYLICRYERFLRASFVMLTAFFAFYVIFIFLPVAGPQYYYLATGLDTIAQGIFPNIGNYFETHSEALPAPGYSKGLFYHLLTLAHTAGERPTAAFPSSHVGVTTLLLWQAWATGNRRFFWSLMPFGLLMFFATFYIQAHYAIDAIAGIFVGTAMYFGFGWMYEKLKIEN